VVIYETEIYGYLKRFRKFNYVELFGKRITEFVKENPDIHYASTELQFSRPYFMTLLYKK